MRPVLSISEGTMMVVFANGPAYCAPRNNRRTKVPRKIDI